MFGKIRDTLDKGVAAVSVKSESLVETSRTKTAINSARQRMNAQISALGQNAYTLWKNGRDFSELEEDLRQIRTIEEEIAGLEKHLEEIRAEEERLLGTAQPVTGSRFCSNCGKALAAGTRFCDECGTPVG